jgi:hypothetical protein
MKTIKKLVMVFGLSVIAIGGALSVVEPAAATTPTTGPITSVGQCSQNFLTFPTWFRGLVEVDKGECVIVSPKSSDELSTFIWHIVLNVIEMGLQAAGYIAAGFILYGGFQFLTSAGDPQLAAKSRTTILNAVIGLGISIAAIAIVNLTSVLWIYKP